MARFAALISISSATAILSFIACNPTLVPAPPGASATSSGAGGGMHDAGNEDTSASASSAGNGGGDAGPSPLAAFASGSRLRATWQEVDGGATLFTGFVDPMLGDGPCAFERATDNTLRCVPSAFTPPLAFVYLDAACTQPAEYLFPGDTPPCSGNAEYITEVLFSQPGDCALDTIRFAAVYKRGALVPTVPVYKTPIGQKGGACTPFMGPPNATLTALTQVDETTLVSATIAEEAVDANLANQVLVGSDGSREVNGIFDQMHMVECNEVTTVGDLAAHCVPTNIATIDGYTFADNACGSAAAMGAINCNLSLAVATQAATCNFIPEVYALGGPLANVYTGTPCASEACPAGQGCYAISAKQSAGSFPALPGTWIGTGATVASSHATSNGTRVGPTLGFVDAKTHEACIPIDFGAKGFRCIPSNQGQGVFLDGYFKDAACTQPVVEIETAECDNLSPSIVVSSTTDAMGCTTMGTAVYEILPQTVPALYETTGMGCAAVTMTPYMSIFREVGPAIDPTTFPLVTVH